MRWIIILFLTVGLFSCSALQQASMRRMEVAACKTDCLERAKACALSCKDSCAQCLRKVDKKSIRDYHAYVHEECVKEGYVARDLNSYRDPLECRKVSCACQADQHVCISACTGVIQKTLRAPPVCE